MRLSAPAIPPGVSGWAPNTARVALLLVIAAATACRQPDTPSDAWATTAVEPAQIVSNTGVGAWTPDDAWRVEEILALGSDLTDEVQFGEISGIEVDGDGNVYVADKLAQQILVFGPDGSPTGTIGGPGEGPGEFGGNIGGVFWIADELIVPDLSNQRVSRFGLDGSFRESFRISPDEGVAVRWDIGDQGLVAQRRLVTPGDEDVLQGDAVVSVRPGAVVDTLRHLPPGQGVQITGGIPLIRPFEPEPVWDTTSEGRFVTAMTNARTFEMRGSNGQVEWVATLPPQASAVTPADRAAVESSLREMYRRQGLPDEISQTVISRMEFAGALPAFASVALGPQGSLWVQEFVAPSQALGSRVRVSIQDMGGRSWSVLDEDGQLLGSVSFPIDFEPVRAVGDVLYGVGIDDLGTESVRAFRVVTE